MKGNSYQKLMNNSLIMGIGELGSKGITLLLVQLYTFYLTQSEYGLVDIIQVTINLLVPIISLSIFEGVLRYVMDKEDTTVVFTNGFFITCIGSLITIFVTFYLNYFEFFNQLESILPYICLAVILQLFQALYSQFVRGIGKIAVFAINGIVIAVTTLCMNLIFIVWLKMGIEGYLLSVIISLIVSLVFINLNVNTFKYLKINSITLKMNKKLLGYSLPLIPNSIMWWIINASSRYFILIFAGTAANGLFAVASKIPSLLTIFNSIFIKAWQLSAVEEYNSDNKSVFYGTIFNFYQQFLFIAVAGILILLKPIFEHAIGQDYYEAWKFVPFLLVSVLFSSFSSFLGTNYIASKKTNGVFKTSVIGGGANLVLNIITIPFLGVIGASLSSMLSFLLITIIRWYDTKKFITIKYNYRSIFINMFLISLIIGSMYLNIERNLEISLQLIIFGFIIANNLQVINSILKILKNKLF